MRRKLAMTAALVVALAVAGYAQKPDFSGTWTPDVDPAAAAAGGGRRRGAGRRGGGRRRWRRPWHGRSDDREADRERYLGRASGPERRHDDRVQDRRVG